MGVICLLICTHDMCILFTIVRFPWRCMQLNASFSSLAIYDNNCIYILIWSNHTQVGHATRVIHSLLNDFFLTTSKARTLVAGIVAVVSINTRILASNGGNDTLAVA